MFHDLRTSSPLPCILKRLVIRKALLHLLNKFSELRIIILLLFSGIGDISGGEIQTQDLIAGVTALNQV